MSHPPSVIDVALVPSRPPTFTLPLSPLGTRRDSYPRSSCYPRTHKRRKVFFPVCSCPEPHYSLPRKIDREWIIKLTVCSFMVSFLVGGRSRYASFCAFGLFHRDPKKLTAPPLLTSGPWDHSRRLEHKVHFFFSTLHLRSYLTLLFSFPSSAPVSRLQPSSTPTTPQRKRFSFANAAPLSFPRMKTRASAPRLTSSLRR